MKLQVFSVRDNAVGLFMPPIFMRSEAEAVRALRIAMRGDHSFAQSPEDYTLYALGGFDEETGEFETGSVHVVCKLVSLVEKGE